MEKRPTLVSRSLGFIQGRRFLNRRLRHFLPERYPYRVHSRLKIFLDTKDLGGPSFYVAHGGPAAFYHYEESVRSDILAHLPADGTFFDLGANIGIHSWFIANHFPSANIYAFEPEENLQQCIRSSIEINGFKNVQLVPLAIGNRDGTASFWRDPQSSGGNSLLSESIGNHAVKAHRDVPVLTLDSFVKQNAIDGVDVIKIDVQDAEDLVLEGAKEVIERFSPVLIVETDASKIAHRQGALFDLPKRYRLKEVGGREFLPLSELVNIGEKQIHRKHLDLILRAF